MLKSGEESDMASQSGLVDRVRSSMCFQSVLGFFFNKGVRGGPRVLLNLAGVLVALIIFVKLLPQRMTESALQSIPQSVWPSLGSQGDDGTPGGLRIVVFGEIDIGTPVGADEETKDPKTWTQALCDQLTCDNHISMVPSPDAASWSISSNELYAHGLEQVLNETADKDGPGQDYSFLSTAFPAQWKASDLKEQVDKFLAMPRPRSTPGSTLWVFSFGSWDVWSLSALPINTGKEAVRGMTKDMFEQIERLYEASQDPNSIAFSDVSAATQGSQNSTAEATKEATVNEEAVAADEKSEKREEVEAEDEASTAAEGKAKPDEFFQILIPRIMDPSLLPGWRDLRPQTPEVHSKAEQMRNAASLTDAWNDGIVDGLTEWVKKGAAGQGDDQSNSGGGDFHFDTVSPGAGGGAATPPTRDGFAYNLAGFVLDQILERQMRNAHQADGEGRGAGALEEGYRDVHNPCLAPVGAASVAAPVAASDVKLAIPNVKIDHDKQVPSKAEDGGAGAEAGGEVRRRGEQGGESKEAVAYLSTARVCEIPGDHLFFTPFALSQRAIWEVAAETAEMIRSGESVRSKIGQ